MGMGAGLPRLCLSEGTVHLQTKVRIRGVLFKENWNGLRKAPRRGSELATYVHVYFFLFTLIFGLILT